jgi:hypothetical protein
MPAPKGHPPYPGCETGGRPLEWTDEKVEAVADQLLEWIKSPGNFWFKDFAMSIDLAVDNLARFAKRNEKFRRAYKKAIAHQESVLFKSGFDNTKNPTMAIFALKCNHKWKEGEDTSGLEDDETPGSRALSEMKQVCIDHANTVEQTGN